MEFYEKLSAYTKSRIKTVEKKRNLVQDIADYLIALDQQLCLLPTRSTLAYKLQQRRICVYTTDVLCCLLEAQDYGGIQLLIANDCCTYVEVVMVCAWISKATYQPTYKNGKRRAGSNRCLHYCNY